MTVPEPYTCELDLETNTTLKVYLLKNVKNVESIKKAVVGGAWSCSAVRAALVAAPLQIAAAANRAALAQSTNTLVTRSVYFEILYNLSLSKNISQSLTKFGVDTDTALLLCFLVTPDSDHSQEIISQIDGELCPISELSALTNMKELKTVYKLNNLKGDVDLVDVIVSRMATKSFVSH